MDQTLPNSRYRLITGFLGAAQTPPLFRHLMEKCGLPSVWPCWSNEFGTAGVDGDILEKSCAIDNCPAGGTSSELAERLHLLPPWPMGTLSPRSRPLRLLPQKRRITS